MLYFIIVLFIFPLFRGITIEINQNPDFLALQKDVFESNISPSVWLSFL